MAAIYVESWNRGFLGLMPSRSLTNTMVSRWERQLALPHPHRWWVAEIDESVVGFAGIGPSRDPIQAHLGELDTIAVKPTHWRKGVGRALMSVAVADLTADGYREATVWTLRDYDRGRPSMRLLAGDWTAGHGTMDGRSDTAGLLGALPEPGRSRQPVRRDSMPPSNFQRIG